MPDHTLDARRAARDQDQTTPILTNAVKPVLTFQAALLRAWAANVVMVADNLERGLEKLTGSPHQ